MSRSSLRFFLAGIMQGSHREATLHEQAYRPRLKALLEASFPGAQVHDPLADHAQSLDYDADLGRSVFMHHNRLCGEVDVVVAFVPEASMGTAIEMWEAHRNRRTVITISPLTHNWAVRFLSDAVYDDVAAFERALAREEIAAIISAKLAASAGQANRP